MWRFCSIFLQALIALLRYAKAVGRHRVNYGSGQVAPPLDCTMNRAPSREHDGTEPTMLHMEASVMGQAAYVELWLWRPADPFDNTPRSKTEQRLRIVHASPDLSTERTCLSSAYASQDFWHQSFRN